MSGSGVVLADAHATRAWAGRLAAACRAELAASEGLVIGLTGEMGAGKTTFVQGFVATLAEARDLYVTSPTFALAQSYATEPPVTHMDLYRLSSFDELEAIGYRDLYFGPGVALVEWIERIPEAIPPERVALTLEVIDAERRGLQVEAWGVRPKRILARMGP